jgi:competence protein ComEC
MLIDGGNNNDGSPLSSYLKSCGVKTIDYLVATHPHEDHIGGLDNIIDQFKIGQIYAPLLPDSDLPSTKTYKDFIKSAESKYYDVTYLTAGDIIYSDDELKIACLSPSKDDIFSNINNYSIVLKINYGASSFLLAGDAENIAESIMLSSGYDLSANLLKMGHHGSSSSSSAEFLAAVNPDYAIISCGVNNSYNHPSEKTLKSLNDVGAQVYRTDKDGSITAVSNGSTITLTSDETLNLDGD